MSTMFNPVGYNPNSHHTIFQHNELSILVDFDEISEQINQLQADLVEEPAKKAVLDAFIHLEKIIKKYLKSLKTDRFKYTREINRNRLIFIFEIKKKNKH